MNTLHKDLKNYFRPITNLLLTACMILGIGIMGVQAQNGAPDPEPAFYFFKVNDVKTNEITLAPGENFTLQVGFTLIGPCDGATATLRWSPDELVVPGTQVTNLIGSLLPYGLYNTITQEDGFLSFTQAQLGSYILPEPDGDGGFVETDYMLMELQVNIPEDATWASAQINHETEDLVFESLLTFYGNSLASHESMPTFTVINSEAAVDCPDLGLNIGEACDDGDDNTDNDMVNEDCECVGEPIAAEYCTPEGTTATRYINNFSTSAGSQNITNEASGFSDGGYGDFTAMTAEQGVGGSVNFSANVMGGTAGFRIWVDWNQDGEFDTTEEVAYQSSGYSSSHSGSFAVPADAMQGETRMRVVSHWLSTSGDVDPCATGFTYGEFEDYTFNVTNEIAYDCPDVEANYGDACDDGNPNTIGEVIGEDCLCGGGIEIASNDEACDATALACGDSLTQSLIGATSSLDDACFGSGSADVWFSFTTDGSQIVNVAETSSFDAVVQLFTGDDCDNLVEAGACQDGPENYTVTEAGTYYFRVRPYFSSNDEGNITVNLTCTDYDCPEEQVNFGDACDDMDPATINDVIGEDCECAGELPAEGSVCESALPLDCNAEPMTYSSSASNGTNTTSCLMGSNGLWFSFMGTGGDITITSVATFDNEMSVNSGSCDSLTNLACVDGGFSSGDPETYTIEGSIDGEMYYVYVAHYSSSSSATGDITINIECATPPVCTVPELTVSAQDADGNAIDCLDASGEYYVLAVLSGGSGNDNYNVFANGGDTLVAAADGSVVLGPFAAGTNANVTAAGAEDGDCEASASVDSPAICAPSNDACADAISIEIGEDGIVGNNLGSTADGPAMDCAFFGDEVQNDVWFSFTAPQNGNLTIETSSVPGSGFSDTQIQVLDGCDGNIIACDEDGGNSLFSKITLACGEYTPGQVYLIQVDGYSGDQGLFNLSVIADDESCEEFDCPQLGLNVGDVCTNADGMTGIVDENCNCFVAPSYDCPQIEANIGDDCTDAAGLNGIVDENCNCNVIPSFDCPDLEANFGDACQLSDGSAGVLNTDCECIPAPSCEDFVYYLTDHAAADGISDIYQVTISGGVATMEYIATSDIEVHIAYNSVDNLLYAVSKHTNSYRTLNPHVIAPSFGPTVSLGADYGELTAAVFNADGKLLIGSQNNNAIYTVSLPNTVSPYDAYSPVTGGDLAFGSDGMLYLATRSGNGLYENYPAPVFDNLIGSVPVKVTGLAITDTDDLLVSAQGQSSLQLYSTGGSNIGSYALELDGEPYVLRDGDMASGCNTLDQPVEGECLNYKLYYVHSPASGNQEPLLEVTLNNDGTASYATVIPNISGHIGLSPDGSIIYNVGNNLKVIDVASASVVATMNITKPNGSNLTGIPAAVVGADGTLYVGKGNQVYTVNVSTGAATPYGPNRSVNGGDLIEVNGEIWVITRNNNTFTNVMTGDSFTVPVTEINGAAVLANGNVLLSDGNGGSLLKEVEIATQSVVATYDIALPLFNGDLAGGCIDAGGLNTQCYGSEILDFNQGLQTNGSAVPADRSDATAALGEPDRSNAPGGFVSLGVGGSITIGFGGVIYDAPGNDIRIWETSYSGDACSGGSDEQADIELSQDGINFVSVGSICRDGEVDIDGSGLDYVSAIRITNSASTGSLDGYDVDGVEAINGCSEEPLIEDGECYATEVVEYIQGVKSNGGAIDANRTNPAEALGAPERANATGSMVFVSLGYGGSLTLAFDGAIPNGPGADIEVVETTWNNNSCATYPEYADVSVSVNGTDFFFVKTVCRADGMVDISDYDPSLAYVNYVRITNNDSQSTTPDAFDVDGVVALHNCEEGENPTPFVAENQSLITSFPNPTSGQSEVVFVTAETSRTLVEVYDMSGRNVATIFDAEAQQGEEYRLDFDGAALPNGVYIYRMTTANETIIDKFMIAK